MFSPDLSDELKNLLAAMLEPNHHLRPSVEVLLGSGLMRKTERWRKLMLLAQTGIQQGVSMCQVSMASAREHHSSFALSLFDALLNISV